jgi:rRNA-processing protein FCF1
LKSKINLVLLDSNFILLPFQFKIDYLNEIRLMLEGTIKFIVCQQVLNELESKKKRQQKSTNFSRLLDSGLLYIDNNKDKYDIEITADIKEDSETTDDFLIRMAIELKEKHQNLYLATNDTNLRKKAKSKNISTIFLRQKKYLSID